MIGDFRSENLFPNLSVFGSKSFVPQNFRDARLGARLARLSPQRSTNRPTTLPHPPELPREEVPELLQQLHSSLPLRCSTNQRELAQKALTALKHRTQNDARIWAKQLADDVADVVD